MYSATPSICDSAGSCVSAESRSVLLLRFLRLPHDDVGFGASVTRLSAPLLSHLLEIVLVAGPKVEDVGLPNNFLRSRNSTLSLQRTKHPAIHNFGNWKIASISPKEGVAGRDPGSLHGFRGSRLSSGATSCLRRRSRSDWRNRRSGGGTGSSRCAHGRYWTLFGHILVSVSDVGDRLRSRCAAT